MSGLSPEVRVALSRVVRAARCRLCDDLSPEEASRRLQEAIQRRMAGVAATPPWLEAALSDPVLEPCWSEPATAGWAHQAFHEAHLAEINARLEAGGQLEADELARKTQLFTDRYMVDWLVDNSLGVVWGAMCAAHGWPDGAAWPCRIPPLPDDLAEHLPDDLTGLRILDPACGTGNFLLVLVERLLLLYRLQSARLGLLHSDAESIRRILEDNLVGADIDDEALAVCAVALRSRAAALGVTVTPRLHALPAPLGALGAVPGAGGYHIVIGNPPYLSARLMAPALRDALPQTPDLYAAFLRRGLSLCGPGGVSAMVTMRGWLFTGQYQDLREHLLTHRIAALGDLGTGAFAGITGQVVSVVMSAIWRLPPAERIRVVAARQGEPEQRRAALIAQDEHHEIRPDDLAAIPGRPLLYWWSPSLLRRYREAPLLGDRLTIRQGMATGNNARFLRRPWEVDPEQVWRRRTDEPLADRPDRRFVPYVKGAAGREWIEGLCDVIDWDRDGMQVKIMHEARYGSYSKRIPSEAHFLRPAACFTKIGARFSARIPRYRSIFDVAGSAILAADPRPVVCMLNSRLARQVLEDLNPTVNFQVGDVARLPLLPVSDAATICANLERAFTEHAAVTETCQEFVRPGPSPWAWACRWAQEAVDRPEGASLPPWEPILEPPMAEDHLSFALSVLLGRLPGGPALPGGALFLSGAGGPDGLDHPAAASLQACWARHALGGTLRDWLRLRFFPDHLRRFESRPVIFPLSSARRTFVILVSIHRWSPATLPELLESHLRPTRRRLRDAGHPALGELCDLTDAVERLATVGPEHREVDAPFVPALSDGVMVSSAAIWPLLHPLWKAPRRWWAAGMPLSGPRSFAWSAHAGRYFPDTVAGLCRQDASLSVAHGCLSTHHPELAARWLPAATR
jgi:SAM-dependent methyltransferase